MNDRDRMDFLSQLDEADVEVSDWEADFISSQLAKINRLDQRLEQLAEGGRRPDVIAFSPKQRSAIDRMHDKYGDHV